MTPERWQQIKALLEAVDEAPEADRATTLDHLCKGDPELRREVEPFLVNAGAGTFLHGVIGEQAASLSETTATVARQERFGHYQLVRRIGQGGMGAVFEAVRVDDFHKRVALKIIKQGLDSDFARTRFLQERQMLASLEHPYIARLLDGGESDDGSPYLVLEFVEGEPVTDYCSKLDRTARLRLFLKICEAVEHAHRNLVVHRDLKPANILVTAKGDPKLLDFGIAKLLDSGSSQTKTAFAAMTPDYASPEQVRGEPITTASDIYSLGVILYQLLTNRKPYSIETASALEMDRVICLQPPAPPGLGDELDHILLMALRKEPERRYGGVPRFAEDIERYLDHRPVSARPDTIRYRARKFVRRNWWQLAAVATVIVSLGAGLGFSIERQRRADRRFNQVRQLANRFLFDFHDEIVNIPGTVKARGMIVTTALEYLNSLAAEAGGDLGLERELAEAYLRVGDVQGHLTRASLGDTKAALVSYRKALSVARRITGEFPRDIPAHRMVASMETTIGGVLAATGDAKGALKCYENALAAADRVQTLDPANRENQRHLAGIILNVAKDQTDAEKSIEGSKKAVALLEELVNASPGDEGLATDLGNAYAGLGSALTISNRPREALAAYLKVLAIRERQLTASPNNSKILRDLMIAESHVGDLLGSPTQSNLGDTPGALVHYRKTVEIAELLRKSDPANKRAAYDHGMALQRLANTMLEGSPAEGVAVFRQSLRSLEQQMAADPVNRRIQTAVLFVYWRIGDGLVKTGDYAGAAANFRRALDIGEPAIAADPKDTRSRRTLLGVYQSLIGFSPRRGQRAEMEKYCAKGLQVAGEVIALDPKNLATLSYKPQTLAACGAALALLAKPGKPAPDAADYYDRSVAAWQALADLPDFGPDRKTELERAATRAKALQ